LARTCSRIELASDAVVADGPVDLVLLAGELIALLP
jgi:hypothetical protein